MWHTTFSTEVRVVEDDSDPARLKTEFELVRSVGDMKQSMYLLAYCSYITPHCTCCTNSSLQSISFHILTPGIITDGQSPCSKY